MVHTLYQILFKLRMTNFHVNLFRIEYNANQLLVETDTTNDEPVFKIYYTFMINYLDSDRHSTIQQREILQHFPSIHHLCESHYPLFHKLTPEKS